MMLSKIGRGNKLLQLLPLMIERVGILVIFAFLLSRIKIFRSIIHHESQWHDKLSLILIFGVFGIISNYTGVEILKGSISTHTWQHELDVSSAIANTRIMGVAIGGMIGGFISWPWSRINSWPSSLNIRRIHCNCLWIIYHCCWIIDWAAWKEILH